MIDVRQVTRFYGRVMAVDNISFQVDKGEILGFLGPNAAGKTTTMRILTTYMPATSGTVKVAGYDVQDQSMQVRKRIGYLPENPPLYMEMRVADYLDFVAKIKGVDPRDRKKAVAEVMDKVGIQTVSGRVIKTLSKGYKQRVGLAQALVHNPDVLILDEPTIGLDPKQIIEVRQLIKSLAGTHTIILSTHILPEVSMTCERVVIINKGRVVAEDTPDNLTRKLAGNQRLYLEVGGPVEDVRRALAQLPGVVKTTVLTNDKTAGFQVESQSDSEIRPLLAKTVIDRGWQLFEMKPEGMSLEDVFLQLTTKEEVGNS
ncbi:MAG TPA: ATP-binding cassette domain-containing protein [bacterium]|nr:ATP-binding cassette domain-containing protein [bacterium]HPN33219.1 ATP-binding cassette domain-containing protein [bacterium]